MEIQNLDKAKEIASQENWDRRLPQYDRETYEPETDAYTHDLVTSEPPGSTCHDPWDQLPSTSQGLVSLKAESDVDSPDDQMSPDGLEDDDDDESTYEERGHVEYMSQLGLIKDRARQLLKPRNQDLRHMGGRKTQVDLTFLQDQSERDRVINIMEGLIKTYSSIPGKTIIKAVSEAGIYLFNVTNQYLSPESDTSSFETHIPEVKGPSKPSKKPTNLIIYPELREGIVLIPKFKGLPKRILRYGTFGLTEEGVSSVAKNGEGHTKLDVIKHSLIQAGMLKTATNLYNLPKTL